MPPILHVLPDLALFPACGKCAVEIDERDRRAVLREGAGGGEAHALGRAGNQCDRPLKS